MNLGSIVYDKNDENLVYDISNAVELIVKADTTEDTSKNIVSKISNGKESELESKLDDTETEEDSLEDELKEFKGNTNYQTPAPAISDLYEMADYDEMFSHLNSRKSAKQLSEESENYKSGDSIEASDEMISDHKAEETIKDLQYASICGDFNSISYEDRQKLSRWAQFNPVQLTLFHNMNSLTSDVDYSFHM